MVCFIAMNRPKKRDYELVQLALGFDTSTHGVCVCVCVCACVCVCVVIYMHTLWHSTRGKCIVRKTQKVGARVSPWASVSKGHLRGHTDLRQFSVTLSVGKVTGPYLQQDIAEGTDLVETR